MSSDQRELQKKRAVLGHYEVLKQLGKGGMGEVFLGLDKNLNRKVAIKVMSRKLTEDPQFVARFKREAQTAAAVSHTNLAQIYELSNHNELHFFVMEFIEGKTVEELLSREKILSPLVALDICKQSATGLKAAADKGLIHRDIKPSNILIDTSNVVKLVDFGLAKAMEDSSQLTQTDMILGTPHYVSPEQARGERTIDFRSDMYSLGVTLYSMVTGKLPFEATTPMGVMLRHVNDPAPRSRSLCEHIPEEVDELIDKMLSKSPDDRFSTYEELIDRISSIEDTLKARNYTFNKRDITSKNSNLSGATVVTSSSGAMADPSGKTVVQKTPASGGSNSPDSKGKSTSGVLEDDTVISISRIEKGAGKETSQIKMTDSFFPMGSYFSLLKTLFRHPLDGWKTLYKERELNWKPLFAFTLPLLVFFCAITHWRFGSKVYSDILFLAHVVSLFSVIPLWFFVPKDFRFGRFKGAMYTTMLLWVTTLPSSFLAGNVFLIFFPIMLYGSLTRFLQIKGKRKYVIFLILFLFCVARVKFTRLQPRIIIAQRQALESTFPDEKDPEPFATSNPRGETVPEGTP